MKDEAVSPVVAFMLLLMVVVSFISVLNAYYIPSLKQQAEIEHLHNVEQSFLKISSDILQVLTFRQNMTMTESIQLGGGDVYFSPIKSSGYLEVNTTVLDQCLANIAIKINDKPINDLYSTINQTKIIFRPVGNFWINQSYEWKDGIISIRKGNKITYLLHTNEENADKERKLFYSMLLPRMHLEEYQNNITSMEVNFVNIENPRLFRSYSGNGAGRVVINLFESNKQSLNNGTHITFEIYENDENFGINSKFKELFAKCYGKNNIECTNNGKNYSLKIPDDPMVQPNVNITRWNLSIHI